MAALTLSSKAGPNVRTVTPNTLTSSDTFTYFQGTGQEILLHNPTAGALSPTITGSAAQSLAVPGGGTVNYAAGLAIGSIAAGASRYIDLDEIAQYLVGTITITGGTGLLAWLMNDQ